MLVLSRHRDESIVIGDDIVITVVDIRGDKVRLGIDAPQDIPVHRREVYEAIQRENQKGAKLKPSDVRTLGNDGKNASLNVNGVQIPIQPGYSEVDVPKVPNANEQSHEPQ